MRMLSGITALPPMQRSQYHRCHCILRNQRISSTVRNCTSRRSLSMSTTLRRTALPHVCKANPRRRPMPPRVSHCKSHPWPYPRFARCPICAHRLIPLPQMSIVHSHRYPDRSGTSVSATYAVCSSTRRTSCTRNNLRPVSESISGPRLCSAPVSRSYAKSIES